MNLMSRYEPNNNIPEVEHENLKNQPLEKESPLGKASFSGSMLNFWGVESILN